jgi:hypothetical protein
MTRETMADLVSFQCLTEFVSPETTSLELRYDLILFRKILDFLQTLWQRSRFGWSEARVYKQPTALNQHEDIH